jgi:23S rRNA (pseudouridine1915-N3)-methyltransferase
LKSFTTLLSVKIGIAQLKISKTKYQILKMHNFENMNIKLIAIGKTDNKNLVALIEDYAKRLSFYIKFDFEVIPDLKKVKHLSEAQQKEKEGELILAKIQNSDVLILLDENGKQMTSEAFSDYLQKHMNSGIKTLIFVIGGPYGFSDAVYNRANGKLGLSKMTFSHQMVRLFFIEQLYRGFTILKNEPYHHR